MCIGKNFPIKIPKDVKTRFDDIADDIQQEKINQYLKSVFTPEPKKFNTIGALVGKKLDKLA